jgi:hypothetical protein
MHRFEYGRLGTLLGLVVLKTSSEPLSLAPHSSDDLMIYTP